MEIFQDTPIHHQSSKLEKTEVTQRRGQEIINVQCPIDITEYQQNMDGVDRGDQLRQHGADFSAKAHFRKWHKRGHFGICDFSLLNSHIAHNLSCERMVHRGQEICWPLKKWEFCVDAAEEMIAYYVVDPQENGSVANIAFDIMRLRRDENCPCLDISELKQQRNVKRVRLSCAVCAVEESARHALKIETPRIFSIKQQGVA